MTTLARSVELYISKKRSFGAPFLSSTITLRAFARFAGELDDHLIKPVLISQFLRNTECSAVTRLSKFSAVKGFIAHLQASGIVQGFELTSPPRPSSYRVPYIFSLEQVRNLLAATDVCQSRAFTLDGKTFRMALLLLYATGASLREVIGLRCTDLKVSESQLVLGESRSRRALPINAILRDSIAEHVAASRLRAPEAYILSLKSGYHVSSNNLSRSFKRLQALIGLSTADRKPPRLQDLRYTFAVHRLRAWALAGDDLSWQLPALSSYMGYASLTAAEQFLAYVPLRFCDDLHKLSPNNRKT